VHGIVEGFQMTDRDLVRAFERTAAHAKAVTAFAFSFSFIASVSLDGMLCVWTYDLVPLAVVTFPFALYATEVTNGQRDMVIGTDNEALLVRGSEIFVRFGPPTPPPSEAPSLTPPKKQEQTFTPNARLAQLAKKMQSGEVVSRVVAPASVSDTEDERQ
jgi:hypothetical protein